MTLRWPSGWSFVGRTTELDMLFLIVSIVSIGLVGIVVLIRHSIRKERLTRATEYLSL